MRPPGAALLALFVRLWSGAAAAQARTDQIAGLMAYIPAAVLTPNPSLEICFQDVAAAQRAVARSPAALVLAIERPIDELDLTPRNPAHRALMTG